MLISKNLELQQYLEPLLKQVKCRSFLISEINYYYGSAELHFHSILFSKFSATIFGKEKLMLNIEIFYLVARYFHFLRDHSFSFQFFFISEDPLTLIRFLTP